MKSLRQLISWLCKYMGWFGLTIGVRKPGIVECVPSDEWQDAWELIENVCRICQQRYQRPIIGD